MEIKEITYNEVQEKQPRNYGVDLLRILSMLMIVLLHECWYGGLLKTPKTGVDVIVWWLYALTYMAVSCYVLVSGYFQSTQQFHLSRLVKLLIRVLFYSWAIATIMLVTGNAEMSLSLMKQYLPISFDQYWFVTTYFGLSLLSPVLNHFIRSINQKQHAGTICVLFVMLALWRDIIPVMDSPFFDNATYSLPLFVELYLIAAYIRFYVDVNKIKRPIVGYFGCTFLMVLALLILNFVYKHFFNLSDSIPVDYYYRNHSLFVMIGAICLFVAFLKLQIKNSVVIKLVSLISPLTLGVYLIHEHNSLRMPLWNKMLEIVNMSSDWLMPFKAIGVATAVFVICLAIDYVRSKVFNLFEASRWYKNMMNWFDRSVFEIYGKIGEITEKISR